MASLQNRYLPMIHALPKLRNKITLGLSCLLLMFWQEMSVKAAREIPIIYRDDLITKSLKYMHDIRTKNKLREVNIKGLRYASKYDHHLIEKRKLKGFSKVFLFFLPHLIIIDRFQFNQNAWNNSTWGAAKNLNQIKTPKPTQDDIAGFYIPLTDSWEEMEKNWDSMDFVFQHKYCFDSPDFRKATLKMWITFACGGLLILGSIVSLVYFLVKKTKKKINQSEKAETSNETNREKEQEKAEISNEVHREKEQKQEKAPNEANREKEKRIPFKS